MNFNVLYPAPSDRVTLAGNGRATATIVASWTGDSPAWELATYLREITGAEFQIRSAAGKPRGTLIVISSDSTRARQIGPEGIRIDTEAGNLLPNGGG